MIKKYLNKEVEVVMDRKLGSKHPKYDWTYPINYGFIPNTTQGDGEEIDAYCIGPVEPLDKFTGTCVAYIQRSDDTGDCKLIVVDDKNLDITDEEILKVVNFQEQFFSPVVIRS